MVDIKYIGHSAFQITNGENAVLIDPFVQNNPKYDWKNEPVRDILLTHAHGDHLGQAIEIAKEKDATITAIVELAQYCKEQGCKVRSVNFGGWINYDWGRAVFVPASHTSVLPDGRYAGEAAGIILDIDGVRITYTNGWALVRASNTGPNVTFRGEATSEVGVKALENIYIPLIQKNSENIDTL